MNATVDLQDLKQKVDIVRLIGTYLPLRKVGPEHITQCCFHLDKHASLKVNEKKQVFKCFACGKGGDVIDFLTLKGLTMDAAIKVLQENAGEIVRPKSNADDWIQIQPKDEIAFQIKHYKFGIPSKIWRYADDRNQLIGFVCRFDIEGRKETIPYTLCANKATKRVEWRWHGFAAPRSLYNVSDLISRPFDIVLLVEGEKTCDAAKQLFPELVCVTWQGGARAFTQTNWTPLYARKIIMVPDNDQPGVDAMHGIASLIGQRAHSLRWVKIPAAYPEHWDLADEQWTSDQAKSFLKRNLYPYN